MTYQVVLPIEENGRLIVTVHSPSPSAIWAMNVEKYSTEGDDSSLRLADISGIGSASFTISRGDESLIVTDSVANDGTEIEFRYRYVFTSTSVSEWSNGSTGDRVWHR